jgi:imidazolonepropionase-like amidohydrolase
VLGDLTSSQRCNNTDNFYSGSDAAGPAVGTAWGLSIHHELFLFVRHCNFSPAEALRAATYLTAKRFGFADRGEIKVGLKADLVLVEGNPMEDIDHTLNLRGVWKDGVLCKTYEGIV